jgi:hypothetical protein
MRDIKKERLIAAGFCSLILALGITTVAGNQGSLQLTVQGYGTVQGRLENATIQPNGTISILMLVKDQLVTSQGTFPTSAKGLWVGTLNGSSLSGQIQDVAGMVQICILMCEDAHFVGVGSWNGQLNGSNASGNFDGAITFTNSPVAQIPIGQPIPVSGIWTTTFQLPMPELRAGVWSYTLVFAVVASALVSANYRRVHKGRTRQSITIDPYAFLRRFL